VLCKLDDIEDGQAKGFTLVEEPGGAGPGGAGPGGAGSGGAEPGAREIFVVREDDRVFGYVNSCPHQGTPLNWQDDRFISDDSGLILCASHGALFEIEDGACVSGPCAGQALKAVALALDVEGRVVLIGD
jgi:nitrite reductase/ring-hydroxylating ferredoxin subunit